MIILGLVAYLPNKIRYYNFNHVVTIKSVDLEAVEVFLKKIQIYC